MDRKKFDEVVLAMLRHNQQVAGSDHGPSGRGADLQPISVAPNPIVCTTIKFPVSRSRCRLNSVWPCSKTGVRSAGVSRQPFRVPHHH